MDRKPKFGECYFYIADDGKIVSRRNTLQDIDILNGMKRNYYFTKEKARLELQVMRLSRKERK